MVLGPLEARARRSRSRDHSLLVDRKPLGPTALARLLAARFGLGPRGRRLDHAARLEPRPTLEPFQPRDLLAQGRVLSAKRCTLLKKPQHQLLELAKIQNLDIWGRTGHVPTESQLDPIWESPH